VIYTAPYAFYTSGLNGVIGAGTRAAVKAMQIEYGLPADSYPSHELLTRLRQ
jgi:peptidoglycan hydrolase-like protein with peptidoglycan-binding domain